MVCEIWIGTGTHETSNDRWVALGVEHRAKQRSVRSRRMPGRSSPRPARPRSYPAPCPPGSRGCPAAPMVERHAHRLVVRVLHRLPHLGAAQRQQHRGRLHRGEHQVEAGHRPTTPRASFAATSLRSVADGDRPQRRSNSRPLGRPAPGTPRDWRTTGTRLRAASPPQGLRRPAARRGPGAGPPNSARICASVTTPPSTPSWAAPRPSPDQAPHARRRETAGKGLERAHHPEVAGFKSCPRYQRRPRDLPGGLTAFLGPVRRRCLPEVRVCD